MSLSFFRRPLSRLAGSTVDAELLDIDEEERLFSEGSFISHLARASAVSSATETKQFKLYCSSECVKFY